MSGRPPRQARRTDPIPAVHAAVAPHDPGAPAAARRTGGGTSAGRAADPHDPGAPAAERRTGGAGGAGAVLAIATTLIVAVNLRPAVASVGPLLPTIESALGLSSTTAALLATLPVACFGVLAPLAPALAGRLGIERAIGLALAVLCGGLVLRVAPGVPPLLAGTVAAGGAIAVINVLLPALIKRDFPRRVGLVTGLYASLLVLAASVAAGSTVPLAGAIGHGWRGGLGFWAVPVGLALVAWAPRLRSGSGSLVRGATTGVRSLLGDRLAWQVTLYLGLQSLGFYAVLSWLPAIFEARGLTPTDAGLLLSFATAVGVPAGIVVPAVAGGARDQRAVAAAVSVLAALGFAGLLLAPSVSPLVWMALLGTGQGAAFPLALTMVALRTRTNAETQRLSAMAQSLGYSLAAAGPLALGALHDATGAWSAGIVLLAVASLLQAAMGLGAGRAGHVGAGHAGQLETSPVATA